jgi:quinol monooxygenase YgiN
MVNVPEPTIGLSHRAIMSAMSETVVIAHICALPGKADALRERLAEVVVGSSTEPGVVRYVLNESVTTPGDFTLVEVYESAAAFDAHLDTDHVKAIIGALDSLAEPNPTIIRTTTVAVEYAAKSGW